MVQSYITSAEETLTTIADYLDKNPERFRVNKKKNQKKCLLKKQNLKKIQAHRKNDTKSYWSIILMKQKLENEKNKVVKPEPNPETGEVPLRTGLASNAIIDKKGDTSVDEKSRKEKRVKNDEPK